MSKIDLICSSCDARFSVEPDEPRRCPECMRSSGLVPAAERTQAPPPPSRKGLVAAILSIAVIVAAIVAWFLVRGDDTELKTAPRPAQADASSAPDEVVIPAELAARPDALSPTLKLVASKLANDADAVVAAVRLARAEGRLPQRPAEDESSDAPRAANSLAPALQGQTTPPASRFEVAILTRAVLVARGFEEARYGYDRAHRHAKTSLTLRRYVVDPGGGKWVDPWEDQPVDPKQVEVLDDDAFMANVLAWRAFAAAGEGDVDRASRASSIARRLAPTDPAVRFAAGMVQVATGLYDLGLETLREVARTEGDAMSWMEVGQVAMDVGQRRTATELLLQATKADPSFAEPHVMLAQNVLQMLPTAVQADHQQLFARIRQHLAAAERIDPKVFALRITRANLALAEDKRDEAEKLLREEASLHPQRAEAWLVMSAFYVEGQDVDKAIEVLAEGAEKGARGPAIHLMRGELLARHERLEEAVQSLVKGLELAPDDPNVRPVLADVLARLEDHERAREVLKQQLKRFPLDATSELMLAQMELNAEAWDAAKARLDKLMKATEARGGPAQLAQVKLQAALLAYVSALARKEGVAEARKVALEHIPSRVALAQVLLEQGILDEAELLLKAALLAEPAQAQPALVALMAVRGKVDEARAQVDKWLAETPEDQREERRKQFELAFSEAKKLRDGQDTPDDGTTSPLAPEEPPASIRAPQVGPEDASSGTAGADP